MDIQLTPTEAAQFQQYLLDRFGPLGDRFGLPANHTPLIAQDHVILPANEGLTYLVEAWRQGC